MPSVYRILDANFNRAREALRVMEEAARFVLGQAELVRQIKDLRHQLTAAFNQLDASLLQAHRDTPADVGTHIKTEDELTRTSLADVAAAAGRRLAEALRAIEEYAKLLNQPSAPSGQKTASPDQSLARTIENLRYRSYELERQLTLALATGRPGRQWKVCLILTEALCVNGDWEKVAQAAIQGGVDCVQLREKSLPDAELLRRARRLVELCRPRGVSVIINDRPDIALLADADGVHVGQTDLPCRQVRKLIGRQLLIGVSTSRIEEARQALADGADYVGLGPMFSSTTKPKDYIAGPAYLRQFLAELGDRLPHLAIGGINLQNIDQLVQAGVRGVAVSSAICQAHDPQAVARALCQALTISRSLGSSGS